MINGIDVSNNNGLVSWQDVPESVAFGLAKAIEGPSFKDSFFAGNWSGMKDAGKVRGAYDFARPDRGDGAAECRTFVTFVNRFGGWGADDLAMLDVEVPLTLAGTATANLFSVHEELEPTVRQLRARLARPGSPSLLAAGPLFAPAPLGAVGSLLDWTLTWLMTFEQMLGFKPLFYSGLWFMQPHNLMNDPTLAQYGLALAAYQSTIPPPPPLWPVLAIWQNSDSGSVPGVTGAVDTDVFNGDLAGLKSYGKHPAAKPKLDTAARLQGCGYLAGGSGVADMTAWLAGFTD